MTFNSPAEVAFDSAIDDLLRRGMRSTHNSAIDAAVKMILLCKEQPIVDIVENVLKLKLEAEAKNEPDRATLSPSSETPQ